MAKKLKLSRKVKRKDDSKTNIAKAFSEIKKQDSKTKAINYVDNLTYTEAMEVCVALKKESINYALFESKTDFYGERAEKLQNEKMSEAVKNGFYLVAYNRAFQNRVDEIVKRIIVQRNEITFEPSFKNKNVEEIEERRILYARKFDRPMLLSQQARVGNQLYPHASTTSFRENYYVSYVPFDVWNFIDIDLSDNLSKYAAQKIQNNTVAVYYPIQDRTNFKRMFLQDVSEEEINEYPLKAVGKSYSVGKMVEITLDREEHLRNFEIVGLDNLEKLVSLLASKEIDFIVNSISSDSFLCLVDQNGIDDNIEDLQDCASVLF